MRTTGAAASSAWRAAVARRDAYGWTEQDLARFLAFTSEDELREWAPEGGPYIGLEAAEVFRIAFKSRQDVDVVYVNAANSEGKVFVIPREAFPSAG